MQAHHRIVALSLVALQAPPGARQEVQLHCRIWLWGAGEADIGALAEKPHGSRDPLSRKMEAQMPLTTSMGVLKVVEKAVWVGRYSRGCGHNELAELELLSRDAHRTRPMRDAWR